MHTKLTLQAERKDLRERLMIAWLGIDLGTSLDKARAEYSRENGHVHMTLEEEVKLLRRLISGQGVE